jgi:hypothetical protein
MLVKHIGGSYIFMTTIIKLLFDHNNSDKLTPMQRLPLLLTMHPNFDALYSQTLSTSQDLPHFHSIISTIALTQEPLSITQIAELLGINTFFVSTVLVNLHSIMQVPGDDRSQVTLWHTSLHDFLCSKDRSGPFYTSPACHIPLALAPVDAWWMKYSDRFAEMHLTRSRLVENSEDLMGVFNIELCKIDAKRLNNPAFGV